MSTLTMEPRAGVVRMSERHLFFAVESGKLHDVKQMLSTLTVNPRDKNGVTLLHRAARSGQTSIVRYLLTSCRFKPTATDKYGWTALHWAAWCGHYEVAQTLVKAVRGSIVNCIDKTGSTPLHLACLQGHDRIIQLLVAEKCNMNLQRKDGWSGLHLAVWNGHIAVIKELLRHGANGNEQTAEGMGAVHLASKKGFVDILRCLLDEGRAAIDMQDKNGNTSLHEAVKGQCIAVIEFLMDRECRINVKNKSGQTPMDIAKANGYSEIILILSGLQSVLPCVPSIACNPDDLKTLMTRLDANCTIRNSDFKKCTTTGIMGTGSPSSIRGRRRKGSNSQQSQPDEWDAERVKSSALGVVLNYEQRIKEIEGDQRGGHSSNHSSSGKDSPRSLQDVPHYMNSSCTEKRSTRVPSAPIERSRLSHNLSVISI